ncbi:MAG: hypothetical protein EBX37_19385, partial [Alphaproteobacteria bacterium]|nr:hypothetical protein [Alphaproteobacteria bacterium]
MRWVPTQATYIGQFKHGVLHGNGVIRYSNSDTFAGSFIDGNKHGKGLWTFAVGGSYIGTWKNNVNLEFNYVVKCCQQFTSQTQINTLYPNKFTTLHDMFMLKQLIQPVIDKAQKKWKTSYLAKHLQEKQHQQKQLHETQSQQR